MEVSFLGVSFLSKVNLLVKLVPVLKVFTVFLVVMFLLQIPTIKPSVSNVFKLSLI